MPLLHCTMKSKPDTYCVRISDLQPPEIQVGAYKTIWSAIWCVKA